MTEDLKQGLKLYKEWVERFTFFEGLTEEQWNNFQTGENLSADDKQLVAEWLQNYDNPAALINQAYNYVYTLVEEDRIAELPEDIQQLVLRWNSRG